MSSRPRSPQRDIEYEYELRDRRLVALGFAGGERGYSDYLGSQAWERARERFGHSVPRRCFVCWRTSCLAHHCTYSNLGREGKHDLVWLCGRHHKAVHTLAEIHDRRLATAHEIERRAYFANRLRERAEELRRRTQAAIDAGRCQPAAGELEPGMFFKVDADASCVRLRFITMEGNIVHVSLTFPRGVDDDHWELRPSPHAA